jgi:hypothetical protein
MQNNLAMESNATPDVSIVDIITGLCLL